jgi:glycosyltransferase involved in cell wall biosynthesis
MSDRIDDTMNEAPLRVVLSTGLGRLHFVKAVEAIAAEGVDISVIQGWVPGRFPPASFIDWTGRQIGAPHLRNGLELRRMPFLPHDKVNGLIWPEILAQLLFRTRRYTGICHGTAAKTAWAAFGRASRSRLVRQDIFHVRSGAGAGGAIRAAKRAGMHVVTDHSIAHPAFLKHALALEDTSGQAAWMSPDDPFWARVLEDCETADTLLVNSDFVKKTFVDQGYPPEKITVAYLGVREDFLALKADYAIGDRPLKLLFTGQFGFRKGAGYLVQALEALASDGIDFHLTVLGDTREAASIVARSTIADRIRMPGFVPQDELKSYLASADMYVFPSLAEGCASSAMEALAAGLPVIATAETGLPARHGKTYFQVPAKDPVAITTAIRTLHDDTSLRQRLGRGSVDLIRSNCSWQSYGKHVTELYQKIVADMRQKPSSGGSHTKREA